MEGIEQKTTFPRPTANATSYYPKASMNVRGLGATLLITLVALIVWGCDPASNDSDHVSPAMSAILKVRRSTNWEVNTAGLPQLTAQESMERVHSLELAGTMEVFPVRPKSGSQDPFNYVIWRDLTTNQFWIVRDSGLSGSTVVFGPGKIEQK
jgi:hypothetical protein